MTNHIRFAVRDTLVALSTVVIVGFASASLDAQKKQFDPSGGYAMTVDGSPGVFVLYPPVYNATARGPAQPKAPTGLLEESGIFLSGNNCVSQPHVIAVGHGVWRADPGAAGRAAQGRTLHAVTDPAGRALGFVFHQITWDFKFQPSTGRVMGGARVEYYDSVENMMAGLPVCSSHSLDVLGYATFPSS